MWVEFVVGSLLALRGFSQGTPVFLPPRPPPPPPPVYPGFDSRTRRHMWVEFVVGSLLALRGFSQGTPVFLPPRPPLLHQCVPGSIPGPGVICGLSLLLLLSLLREVFLCLLQFSPLLKNQHFLIPIRTGMVDEEPLCGCATTKSLFIYLFILYESNGLDARDYVSLAAAAVTGCIRTTLKEGYFGLKPPTPQPPFHPSGKSSLVCLGNF